MGIGSSRSSTNQMSVVATVMRVLGVCLQFHRRQVTPSSSRQTTSPASTISSADCPSRVVSKDSLPAARTNRGGPAYADRSSPPTGTACVTLTAL